MKHPASTTFFAIAMAWVVLAVELAHAEEAIGCGETVVVRGEDSRAPSGDFTGVPQADCAAQLQSDWSTP